MTKAERDAIGARCVKDCHCTLCSLWAELERLEGELRMANENISRWRVETDEREKLQYKHLAEDITKSLKRLKVYDTSDDGEGHYETVNMPFEEAWNFGYWRGMGRAAQYQLATETAEAFCKKLINEREEQRIRAEAAEAELARLRKALWRYGKHEWYDCETRECRCGLTELRSGDAHDQA